MSTPGEQGRRSALILKVPGSTQYKRGAYSRRLGGGSEARRNLYQRSPDQNEYSRQTTGRRKTTRSAYQRSPKRSEHTSVKGRSHTVGEAQQAESFRGSNSNEGATTTIWHHGSDASNASAARVVKWFDSWSTDRVLTPPHATAAGKGQMCVGGITSEDQRQGSPERSKHGKANGS